MEKLFRTAWQTIALTLTAGTLLSHAAPALPTVLERQPQAIPSRTLQSAPGGFYLPPAGLADDYPEETTTVEGIRADMEVLRQTGAKYFRFAIGWDGVEVEPGTYEWRYWDELVRLASAYGITLLPYVCYTPAWLSDPGDPDHWRRPPADLERFGAFMYAIASRYRGKIASWELWNEPDIEHYWLGTPAEFAAMIREGARQVRRADPQAVVVLGGMARGRSPFLEELLRDHDLGREVDVINMHGYFETWGPERAEEYPPKLQEVRDLIAETAPGRDLWLAEFGYSSFRQADHRASKWAEIVYEYEHSPAYQAVALWKHHVLAAASEDLSLTTWYRIRDLPATEGVIGDDNNKHLGIIGVDGRPKPAFFALRLYNRLFDRPFRPVDGAFVDRAPGSHSVVNVFEKEDGNWIVTAWLRSQQQEEIADRSGRAVDERRETISIRLPLAGPARWKTYRVDGSEEMTGILPVDGTLRGIRLTGDSVYIAEIVRAGKAGAGR